MCGITGIYYLDKQNIVNQDVLQGMNDVISHRGPDDEGLYIDQNVGIAQRRLSIIDLSLDGHQPMCNEDGSIWIVFNGEFFNYLEYRDELLAKGHKIRSRSDTEYLIHLYEEYGKDVVHKINGMFAFVIWDNHKQQLLVARDRLGIKPLHYYLDGKKLLFGSEIKSILKHPNVDASIDLEAISDYFSYMSIPAPKTVYKNIRKLKPGHLMVIKSSNIQIEQYWDLKYQTPQKKSDKEYIDEFTALFEDAVEKRMLSDVPLGAFLSGGVDSSAVVAMMSQKHKGDVKTFSIGFKGFGEFDETPWAQRVSEQYQTIHKEFNLTASFADTLPGLVWHFDEPFAVSSAFAIYFLAKMTREYVTVSLSGDGSDELFAGYPFRYSHDYRYDKLECMPLMLRKAMANVFRLTGMSGNSKLALKSRKARDYFRMSSLDRDMAYMDNFSYYDQSMKNQLFTGDLNKAIQSYNSSDVFKPYFDNSVAGTPLFKRQLADIKTTLADEMLKKVDNMTMAVALEARVPFLDYRLVEFSARIPDHLKLNPEARDGKVIIKKAMANYLDHDLLYRKKHGFNVPFGEWVKKELWDFVNDHLSTSEFKQDPLFNHQYINKIMYMHKAGKFDYGNHIYQILCYSLWKQSFKIKY